MSATMIIRNFGGRQVRRALAATPARSCRLPLVQARSLSTELPPTSTTTTTTTTQSTVIDQLTAASTLNPENAAISEAEALKAKIKQIPDNYRKFKNIQRNTQSVGSHVELRYLPDEVLKNPPHDASLEMLMASQAHLGHHTSLWNPANARYIYGVRDNIHIISLEVIAAHLRRAARVVEEVAYHGGLTLFVGTRPGQMASVVRSAELAGACHLFTKWTPGTITNRDQLLAGGQLQIVDEQDRPLDGFEKHLQDRRPVIPDLVVCLNPLENYVLLYECGLASIPTIGVIDTDADPTWVTYQIPANDDSLRATALIAGVLSRAGERGQQRRREEAKDGVVTWKNPLDVEQFITRAARDEGKAMEDAITKQKEDGGNRRGNSQFMTPQAIREMLSGDAGEA